MNLVSVKEQSEGYFILSGELNRHSVPSINLPKLAVNSQITLDLEQLNQVDTAGLAWLIDTLSQLQRNHISLKLVNLPEQLKKLMKLGDVENLFE